MVAIPCRFDSGLRHHFRGSIAQLGEHLFCTQGVEGSSPFGSTIFNIMVLNMVTWRCSLAGYSVRFIPGRSGVQIPPPLPFLKKPKWTFSSVGQSSRLITGWSGVRVPEGPPFLLNYNYILLHSKSYTEEYPSLAEGIGLENRQGVTAAGVRIPLPPPFF